MKRQIKIVSVAWLIGLLSAFGGWSIAAAQDTELPPTQEIAITATALPETPTAEITAEPTQAPNPINTENAISVASLLYGFIIAILGGGTVAVILNRFGSSKVNLDASEKLFQALSPDAQLQIREMFEGLREVTVKVIDLVDKITDGKPNVDVVAQVKSEVAKQLPAAVSNEVTAQAASK